MENADCKGCAYWRYPGDGKCCHYMIYTSKRRVRDGDRCLSYEPKRKKRTSVNRKCSQNVPEVWGG